MNETILFSIYTAKHGHNVMGFTSRLEAETYANLTYNEPADPWTLYRLMDENTFNRARNGVLSLNNAFDI